MFYQNVSHELRTPLTLLLAPLWDLMEQVGTRPARITADLWAALRAAERLRGLHLVRQLRQNPSTARVPIVVLTARGDPDTAAEGLAAGADDYLTKPFSSRELLARIRSNHELQRAARTGRHHGRSAR